MTDMEMLQAMEKLLNSQLQPIQEKLGVIEQRQDSFENKLDKFENKLDKFENKLDKVEERLLATQAFVEKELPKQIKMIAGQYGDIIEKLDALADYPQTKDRVTVLERVAQTHTQQIDELHKGAV